MKRSFSPPMLRSAAAAVALLCGLGGLRADVRNDVRIALVVGNSAYKTDNLKLPNAAGDAAAMAESLRKDGFDVVLRTDVPLTEWRALLKDFSLKSEKADISLFYYAGHGVQYRGENYLLPVDNAPRNNKDVQYDSVAMKDVVVAASDARKSKIIIIDACRNSKPDPKPDPRSGVSRSVTGVGDGDGLAAIDGAKGLVVFYSAQHGKVALDSADDGAHSPFAEALLQRVAEPGRQVEEIFTAVSRDVAAKTHGGQVPEIVTASLETEIVLNPKETSADAWRALKQSSRPDDPEALHKFIDEYPASPEAEIAQSKLDRLDLERRERAKEAESQKREAELAAVAAAARQREEALQKEAQESRSAADARQKQIEADKAAQAKQLEDLRARLEADQRNLEERLAAERKAAQARLAEQEQAAKARDEEQRRKAEEAEANKQRAEAEKARIAAEAEQKAAEAKRKEQEAAEAARRAALVAAEQQAKLEAAAKAEDARIAAEAAKKAEDDRRRAESQEASLRKQAEDEEQKRRQAEADRALQARLEEQKRQQEEAALQKQRVEAACARDIEQLAAFRRAHQLEPIEVLRRATICPSFSFAADQAIKGIAEDKARTCNDESADLARIGAANADALKSHAETYTCEPIRSAALDLIEKLQKQKLEMETLCTGEHVAVAAIDVSTPSARAELGKLGAGAKCPATRVEINGLVAAIDSRVASAQRALVRLECLNGNNLTGRFDAATTIALAKYLESRNAPAGEPRIMQSLIEEMNEQRFGCIPETANKAGASPKPATAHGLAAPPKPAPPPAAPPAHVVSKRHYIAPEEAEVSHPEHEMKRAAASKSIAAPRGNCFVFNGEKICQ